MFKLPDSIPTYKSKFEEICDYAEYLALQNGMCTFMDILKPSLMGSDEIDIDGIEDETDRFIDKLDYIGAEINRRILASDSKYPFKLTDSDYVLRYEPSENEFHDVYLFLLMATRLNMKNDRVHAGHDGTELFEFLCAEIALNYFGNNTEGEVFGTSNKEIKGFKAKLTSLAARMREGGSIIPNTGLSSQDEKLDIVIWKGFSDRRSSQLIAFGQCKTGTSWKKTLADLDTTAFCHTWFSSQPKITPLKLFFCAQYFNVEIWEGRAHSAGLIFDRYRIMDYLPSMPKDLMEKIKAWTETATQLYKLN